MTIFVSAGEASGDRYAADLIRALRKRLPQARFVGCGGPRMREQGVEAVVHTEELAVVGLFEVVRHIPRLYGLLRRLDAAARDARPDLAILTDAPDFHLRLAARLRRVGVPVAYYVAPQVWAWRRWRIHKIRRLVQQLLVIFPFEEEYFRRHDVRASFVGHPLSNLAQLATERTDFFRQHALDPEQALVALLPGSRKGESLRHLATLQEASERLTREGVRQFVLPAAATTGKEFYERHWRGPQARILDGQTQDCIGHSDVALVASGSATVEAALLGTPMVTFYKLSWPSYQLARMLVNVPFYSMVNLLAGKRIVAECIQAECTGEKLAQEALRLLRKESARCQMKEELARLRAMLRTTVPAAEQAASLICEQFQREEA